MTCFMYIDGKKQEMNEDIFDQMVEALNPETVQDPPQSKHPQDGEPMEPITKNP